MPEQSPESRRMQHIKPATMYELTREYVHRLQLVIENEPVGYAELEYYNKPFPFYYLSFLQVSENHKGQQFGSFVLDKFNSFLKEKGKAGILYDAMKDSSAAKGIYARHGWLSVAGKKDWYVYNPPQGLDDISLHKAVAKLDEKL